MGALEPSELLALAAAVRDRNERQAEAEQWTTTHELLAQLIEWVSLVRVEALAIGQVPSWKLPKVHRVPRPGDDKPGEVVMSPRDFALMTAA